MPKFAKIEVNCAKYSKTCQNMPNIPKHAKICQYSKTCQNVPRWAKMCQILQSMPKCAKYSKTKWQNIYLNIPKCINMCQKICQPGKFLLKVRQNEPKCAKICQHMLTTFAPICQKLPADGLIYQQVEKWKQTKIMVKGNGERCPICQYYHSEE